MSASTPPGRPAPAAPRVVLVVDGSRGAGRIVSTRLATSGAAVAVVATGSSGGAAFLSKELTEQGLTALPYRVDPGDPAGPAGLLADIEADLGPVDLVVHLPPPGCTSGVPGPGTFRALAAAGRAVHVIAVAGPDSGPGAEPESDPDAKSESESDPGPGADPAGPAGPPPAEAGRVRLTVVRLPTGAPTPDDHAIAAAVLLHDTGDPAGR